MAEVHEWDKGMHSACMVEMGTQTDHRFKGMSVKDHRSREDLPATDANDFLQVMSRDVHVPCSAVEVVSSPGTVHLLRVFPLSGKTARLSVK